MELRPSCSAAMIVTKPHVVAALLLGATLVRQGSFPPYSPQEALGTFQIAEGFRIEPFAAEPLVSSPVAMEVDEDGRVFVVEMHGYPLDVGGSGRIKVLEDSDGDGRPDRATVFADGLRLPAGIMKWKRGVLVTDSPQVWYLEDSDGDGRADIRREVLTGFALTNPQHTTNTPLYGLDNWIYLANEGPVRTIRYRDLFGDAGGEVRYPDRPDGPRLPPDADGRNVRFRPDTFELETLSARSQFGSTFDAWGHHFNVTNSRHIFHEVMAARYVSRNPDLIVPSVIEQVPDYRLPAEVFPITRQPEFQLLTDVGVMTSASGLTYYLADLFPPAYRTAAFVAEGAHNLVHVASVRDHGVTFRASRMFEGREFLASTDSWFRPVNFYIGPDGALYLIDYYRKILEHPEWLDDATARSPNLSAGRDRGRIYRIVPDGTPPPAWMGRVGLGRAPTTELLAALERPNIWWRRHAQRLLVDRKATDAAGPLEQMATGADSGAARVHALWTLEGLGKLDTRVIGRALHDPIPGVRENAIRLAELHLRNAPELTARLLGMHGDPDPKVRFQLLLTLGDVDSEAAAESRSRLLFTGVEDTWMQAAALSARGLKASALLARATDRLRGHDTAGGRALFSRLGSMAAATPGLSSLREVVRTVAAPAQPADAWWRAATLEGLAAGIPNERRRRRDLDMERRQVAEMLLRAESADVRHAAVLALEALGVPEGAPGRAVRAYAERLVADSDADPDARADAVRLLAGDAASLSRRLRPVLSRPEPAAVHVAAIRAVANVEGDAVGVVLLELWDRWTPAVRDEAVRALMREPGRIRLLVDAVADGRVKAAEIDRPSRVRLMMVDDDELRARTRALFGGPSSSGKDGLSRYAEVETLAGDSARGREVFSRLCSACHQYRSAGGTAFGPDLGEVRNRLPMALVTDILHPNSAIADGYELWTAELKDGSRVSGVIGAETPSAITFKAPGGAETVVLRARIVSLRVEGLSAMPEGLGEQLDVQAMADLIAFIRKGS